MLRLRAALSGELTWPLIPFSSIAFLRRMGRTPSAAGSAVLLSALLVAAINAVLPAVTAASVLDVWDLLSICVLLTLALVSFAFGRIREKE